MNITANGTYVLSTPSHSGKGISSTIVYVSGALGAATGTLSYINGASNAIALTAGAVSIDEQYKIDHGVGVTPVLVVTGADGSTDIEIDLAGVEQ